MTSCHSGTRSHDDWKREGAPNRAIIEKIEEGAVEGEAAVEGAPTEGAAEGEAKKEEEGKEKSAEPSDDKSKTTPVDKKQSINKEKETKKK